MRRGPPRNARPEPWTRGGGAACPLGEAELGAPRRYGLLPRCQHHAKGLRAGVAVHWNHSPLPGRPAEQGNVAELALEDDNRGCFGQANHFDGLVHRLVLHRDQVRPGRDLAGHPRANAKQVLGEPVLEAGPRQDDRPQLRLTEQGGESGLWKMFRAENTAGYYDREKN